MERVVKSIVDVPDCLTRIVNNKPVFLRKGLAWKENYEQNRNANLFNWGQYQGINNSEHIVRTLQIVSAKHCFYCDAKEVDYGLNRPEIDHFEPKTKKPIKAYYYPNLFLSCSSCNVYKSTKYNKKYLLKFDTLDYNFDDYFYLDFNSGEVLVRPDISYQNQVKARYTRLVLGINKAARPSSRKKQLKLFLDSGNPLIEDFSYRFYINRSV